MNQAKLRQLTTERITDAVVLLAGQRWAFAYYVAGYAVECGLKSCVLARMIHTGLVFEEKKPPDFRVHDLEALVGLAGLRAELGQAVQAKSDLRPVLGGCGGVAGGVSILSDGRAGRPGHRGSRHRSGERGAAVDSDLLVRDRFEAGREFINRLHRSGFDVTAAGWLRHTTDDTWRLYVVTGSLDPGGLIDGYRAVYDALIPLDATPISIGEVKLVRPSDPIGRAVRELADKFDSQPRPSWEDRYMRTSTSDLTDLGFSWAMVYSPAGRMVPKQVVRVVADIITAAGSPDATPQRPAATFEHSGRTDRLHPTAVRFDKSTKRLLVEGDAADTGTAVVIPADEITDIRLQ